MISNQMVLRRELMLFRFHARKKISRIRQLRKSLLPIAPANRSVHILCLNRAEYLDAAIKCANSIWEHSPEIKIVIHLDIRLKKYLNKLKKRLDRSDRFEVRVVDDFSSWQKVKLNLILQGMAPDDFFCDADLYWNSKIPAEGQPYYFVREEGILQREPYLTSLNTLGFQIDEKDFMANSSVISLSGMKNRNSFIDLSLDYFEKITSEIQNLIIDESSKSKILRLSEQLALSLAISRIDCGMRPLKLKDLPMDNGIAESYYLGTTKGWS